MDSKLVLLLGGDHRNLQRSHREILDALGYQLVTSAGNGSLDELINRLKPDLVLFPSEVGGTVSATELQGKHPDLKLVELEPVRLVERTSRNLPVKVSPSAEMPPALQKALYSRKEAAWSLGISLRSLDTLLASKQIAFRRLGRKVMIPAGEVKRISRQNTYVLGARESG